MDTLRLRRVHALQRLVDERFDGNAAALAREVGLHPTFVSNMLAAQRREKGVKPITDKMAERIEHALELEPGALSAGEEAPPGADPEARRMLRTMLALVETETGSGSEQRLSIERLRAEVLARDVLLEVTLQVLIARDRRLGPLLVEALRIAAARGAELDAPSVQVQSEALALALEQRQASLEEAAQRAALRAAQASAPGHS